MENQITYGARTEGVEIVSLEMAKANAKIEHDEEDVLLQLYLDAITDEIERFCGRVFVEREVTIGLNAWSKKYDLPVSANVVIDSIGYKNEDGIDQPLVENDDYKLYSYDNGYTQRILFKNHDAWKLQDLEENEYPITITAKVGYTSETMPADIKSAALLMFNNKEAYRENMPIHLNRSAEAILRAHKRY